MWKLVFMSSAYIIPCLTSNVTKSVWAATKLQDGLDQQADFDFTGGQKVRSKLECFAICRRFWNCVSLGYDAEASICYLQSAAGLANSSSGGQRGVRVYDDLAPICSEKNAPAVNNGYITKWRRSLTSLEGDVTCMAGFGKGDNNSLYVQCLPSGWKTKGDKCKRRIWADKQIELDVAFALPGTPKVGWSLCLKATPTAKDQFSIDLQDVAGDSPLLIEAHHSFFIFNAKLVIYSSGKESAEFRDPSPVFPFVVNQQFTMTLTAIGLEAFNIWVDDNFYVSFNISATIEDISSVTFSGAINVTFLDLWCS